MLRLSPGERALVEALAAYIDVGMADAIRIALRSHAAQVVGRHRFRVPADPEERAGLLAALLNQRAARKKPK